MNKLTEEEIRKIIDASDALGIVDYSILEKDVFVTKAIHSIADMNHPAINLVFCGGTCLSKAYQIVNRMSEDVDFKIYPAIPFISRSDQRRKLNQFRNEMTELLMNAGFEVTQQNIGSRDNNGYTVYRLDYPSNFNKNEELREHIQLEFTLAPPRLPTTMQPVVSLMDRVFTEDTRIEKNIACISVLETAAEKWVALTRRIASIARGHDKIDETLVRHIYDLNAITNKVDLTNDFFALVSDTIDRDRTKFKRHHEYGTDTFEEIKYSLKILGNDPVWLKNYDAFVEAMVFDKENADFNSCYKKLENMTERTLSQLHLEPNLTWDKSHDISAALTPTIIKQLKLYVEMQLRLTKLCDEKKELAPDSEKYQELIIKAKSFDGHIRKLAKEITKMPEIEIFLSNLSPLDKTKHSKQAAIIHERFQKNEITIEDINTVLQHVKHNALKLSKEICHELKF